MPDPDGEETCMKDFVGQVVALISLIALAGGYGARAKPRCQPDV